MEDVEEIAQVAKAWMLEKSYHEPTIFIKGSKGKRYTILEQFGKTADERVKDMLNLGTMMAVKRDVGDLELIVFVSEAWMGRVKKDGTMVLPSQDPKRVETLMITYLDAATKEQGIRMFEVVRNKLDKVIDIKQAIVPEYDSIESPLLPAFLKGYQFIRPINS